jgi:hypothetical protein
MKSRAQYILEQMEQMDEIVSGIVAGAAISTAGQQLLAKKRREEKVRQGGHGDELDAIKKKRSDFEKHSAKRLLVGKKAKAYKAQRADLKAQHSKIVNKGLASHAQLMSRAGQKGQQQMQVR